MIKADLQKKIQAVCTELGIVREVVLEHPQILAHGDFATSIALSASKDLRQNPKELAEAIATKIQNLNDEHIENVSVAGPGFINITLTKHALHQGLEKINESYGTNNLHKGKKILIEHSSPNLFKPFHIGHLMNNAIGEAIARIIKNTDANVEVISYPSDISLGIAKAIWVMLQDDDEAVAKMLNISEQLRYIGDCYVHGTASYEQNDEVKAQVKTIMDELVVYIPLGTAPTRIMQKYYWGKGISEMYFTSITHRLGSLFNGFVYESQTGSKGKEIVLEHVPDIFTESEGAIIYEGEKRGLHTRVFINKEGNPTYEAKDIGLLAYKFEMYNPVLSIFVTDHEQGPYFKVVSTAAGEINKEWQEKTVHLTHGRMQFKGERMSSRLGGIPTALEVIETIKEVAKEKFTERSAGMDTDAFADMVAIAALKFSILKVAPGKPVNFDPEEALSFEGDSGPYIQYTYVRTQTLLEKGRGLGITPSLQERYVQTDLERILYRFEEVTARAAEEYAPHYIAHYILEVAQMFNSWYGNQKIVDEADREASAHYLAISQKVGYILKRGLYLLGIETPERM